MQLWQNFYDPSTSHIVTSTPVAGNDKAHQFIEYITTTSTQHHVAATPIPSVVTYVLLPTVNWNTVIPAMVTFSRSSSVTVTYHEQVTPERVIPSDPWTFMEYAETLSNPVHRLFHSIQFTPGGEQVLHECLLNNKILKIGTDGSASPQGEADCILWLDPHWHETETGGGCRPS